MLIAYDDVGTSQYTYRLNEDDVQLAAVASITEAITENVKEPVQSGPKSARKSNLANRADSLSCNQRAGPCL